ncbi:MAG: hypothetical protein LBH12_00960 [Dysgonamonadaceae bacterium]|nr:hypothetical protein [Dysgonamonadaceae bacterium]
MKVKIRLLVIGLFSAANLLSAQTRPLLSTGTDEYWYYIRFSNGGNVIQDMGDNANLQTKAKVEGQNSQLWKLTGTPDNYVIVSKEGRKINHASERFKASSTASVTFALIATSNATYAPAWELKKVGQSDCINQYGGAGIDKELGLWTAGDNNNPLSFVAADPLTDLIPETSDENNEIWYYILFKKGGAVLQDMGAGEDLKTKIPRRQDSQLWKFLRSANGYVIESKSGNRIVYSGDYFKTDRANGVSFNFRATNNTTYAPALELRRVGSVRYLNQWGFAGPDRRLGEWDFGDDSNSVLFVKQGDMVDLQESTVGKLSEYVGCTKIKTLRLPACATIRQNAFSACVALKQLNFPYSNPPIYGKDAFPHPETVTIELDGQDKTIVEKWRKISAWNAFQWAPVVTGTETPDNPKWQIKLSGNNLTVSGLLPSVPVGIVTATGLQSYHTPSQDGYLNLFLPSGFYLINQQNKTERIIITE